MINLQLIHPYNFVKAEHKPVDKSGLRLNPPLAKDTVSFGKKADLLSLSKNEIFGVIEKSVQPENFLGEGYDAICFRIPDTGYCVRFIRENFADYNKSFSTKLTETEKQNHVVAKLGGGSQIQKYIEGYPVEPVDKTLWDKSYKEIAEIVDKVPVESYVKLLRQVSNAYKQNLMFDSCGTNLIVNPKTLAVTAIDFYQNDEFEPEVIKPLQAVFLSLINKDSTLQQRRRVAGKALLASFEEFESKRKPCLNPDIFDYDYFLNVNFNTRLIKDENQYEHLQNTVRSMRNLKSALLKKYDTKLVQELEDKVHIARALVTKMYLE